MISSSLYAIQNARTSATMLKRKYTRGELTRGPTPTDGRCSIANVRSPANHRVSYGNVWGEKKKGGHLQKINSLTKLIPRLRRRHDRAFMHQRPQPTFPPSFCQPFRRHLIRRHEFLPDPALLCQPRRAHERRRRHTVYPPVNVLRLVEEAVRTRDAGDDGIQHAGVGLGDRLDRVGARVREEEERDRGMVERLNRG